MHTSSILTVICTKSGNLKKWIYEEFIKDGLHFKKAGHLKFQQVERNPADETVRSILPYPSPSSYHSSKSLQGRRHV